MSANVESMFYVGREKPWHGLGTSVEEALTSDEAIKVAGLDWNVNQDDVFNSIGVKAEGYKMNIRSDGKVLGIVSDRYKIVQNKEAFEFTDSLIGEEQMKYETAGSLSTGKRIWLLGRLPKTIITDEEYEPYIVFTNSHDGKGSINACITPIRVVCQNTLNLALKKAKRSWSCCHKGNINSKLEEAKLTIFNTKRYIEEAKQEFGALKLQKLDDDKVVRYLDYLLPTKITDTERKRNNSKIIKNNIMRIYQEAPDLQDIEKSAYRFINAVSDFATHSESLRKTETEKENRFIKTVDGNRMIDEAYKIILSA